MPKVKILQSNFSSGEFSPQALGRVDIARYPNAVKTGKNILCKSLGGAKKRWGTRYIGATKHNTGETRLVPYIISRDSAYMLEIGHYYGRVYKTDGTVVESSPGVPYEFYMPYQDSPLIPEFDYSQTEDSMLLFHNEVFPQRLVRYSDTNWKCSDIRFTAIPFDEIGYPAVTTLYLSAATVGTGRTVTAAGTIFLESDVGRAIIRNAGIAVITAFTSATEVTAQIKSAFESTTILPWEWEIDGSPHAQLTPGAKDPVGASISLLLDKDGWRSADVGAFIQVNSGLVQITSRTDAKNAVGIIIKELSSAVACPSEAWTLEYPTWDSRRGYPSTGTMHEQRLVVAGTTRKPQTVWGSVSGDPYDFTKGIDDADSFAFTVAGDDSQTNQINYAASSRDLLLLSYGGEFSMRGGVEKPITPTNVQIKGESPHGCRKVRPVQVGKETIFVQRAGRKVRAMGYKYDEDGYKSPDLTTLAEHITETGVAGFAFQQEPDPILWVWLNNGRLLSCTIDRDLDIVAWTWHELDGAVESVAVMPAGDSEQVWLIVRRSIDGAIVKYVERFEQSWYPIYGTESPDPDTFPIEPEPMNWGFTLDCAVTQDDVAGKATWDGLDHLEGKTVRCLADGVDMGEFTVTGGEITLPRTAHRVLIGVMFTPLIVPLLPEIQMGTGSIQADAISINSVSVRVVDTISCTVGGSEIIAGRENGPADLDTAPTPYTGDKDITKLGWAKGGKDMEISQAAPFPWHILAVIRTITANGG